MKTLYQLMYVLVVSVPTFALAKHGPIYYITDSAAISTKNKESYPVKFINVSTEFSGKTAINVAADEINYYHEAQGKSGAALKNALNNIIKQHHQFTYKEVWDQLEYTDEDINNNANIIMLYIGRSVRKNLRVGKTKNSDAWNREHVWAKSHGFPDESQFAYTDIHHLRPASVSLNSRRGNKDFDWGGDPIVESPGNKTDGDSFEPTDSVKGDVSRMLFYMDVRYQGNDNSRVGDLVLVDKTGSHGNQLGKLCTLLAWHRKDPVSDWERRRNERIYERQGNRNPFIDHPEWAVSIYSDSCKEAISH